MQNPRRRAEPAVMPQPLHVDFTHKPSIILEKYNGNSPWADYFSHFEMCAVINNWSENEKGCYLTVSLRGDAQQVLASLPVEQRERIV